MQSRSRKPYYYYERDEQKRGDQHEGRRGRGRGFIETDFLPSATVDHYCPYEATTQSDTEAEEERAFWKRDRWQRQQMQQIQQQQKKRECGKSGGIYRQGSLLVTAPIPSEYRQMMMMRQNEAPFHDFPSVFEGGIHHRQNQQHQFHRFFPPYPNPHSNNHNQKQKNKKKGGEKQTMPWLQQPPPHLWCSTPKTFTSTSPESSSPSASGADSEDEEQDENNTSQTTDGSGEEAGKSPEFSETEKKKMDHHLREFAGKVGEENIEEMLEKNDVEDDKENSFNGNDEDEDDDGGSVYFRPATSKKTTLGPLTNLNLMNNGNVVGKKATVGGGRKKQKQQKNRCPRPFHKQHQAMVGNPLPSAHQNPYGYGGQTTVFAPHSTFLQQPTLYFGDGGGYDFLDPPRAAILQQHNHQQQQHQVQQQHLKHSKLPNRQHRRSIRRLLLPPFDKAPTESAVNAIDAAIVSAPIVLDHRDHRLLTEQQQQKRQREQQFFFFHNSSPVGAATGTTRRNRTRENAKDCLDVTYKNLIDLKLAETPPKNGDEKAKNTVENNEHLNNCSVPVPSGAEAITAITPSSTRSPDPQEFQCRLVAMAEEDGGEEESSSNKERDATEETHFVNYEEENENDLSGEKPHYENILQSQRALQRPMPTAPGAAVFHPVQPIEDGSEVYGRLVALSLLECAGPGQSESVRRGVPVARRQIEELLGIDPKHTESLCLDPAAVAGEEMNQRAAEFAHSCALFGSLVAAHLRAAQALDDALDEGGRLSGRQHNGRLHRLHRILDRLKRGELVAARVGTDQKSGPFGAALLGKLRASGGRHSRLRTLWRRVTARIF